MENGANNDKERLVDYVADQVRLGIAHDEIKKRLAAVGWSDEDADSAYALGLTKNGIPVPTKNTALFFSKKSTTVEIVVNFFSFILLGISSISLGTLLYGVINHFFEDKLTNNYYAAASSSVTVHYAIAALIIGFPLYYFAMRFWFDRFKEDEGKVEARLTKWITYLVLLVTAIIIVGDLIAVIFNMLQGEITTRFFLKALTIFMISGGIFSFYFLERKKIQYKKTIAPEVFRIFSWAAGGVVLVSIILGFFASGLPQTERMRNFDNTRSSDLESLSDCIDSYAANHKALPESLDELGKDSAFSYCAGKKDPETGSDYAYRIVNRSITHGDVTEGEFELCADFALASDPNISRNSSKWFRHGSGRSCNVNNTVLDNGDKTRIKIPQ